MKALLALCLLATLPAAADDRRSGRDTMSPALRTLQADDGQHPAQLALALGRELWSVGPKSCASCHGEPERLRGAATVEQGDGERPVDDGRFH